MAKAVGLDIGSRACKVAVLDGGPKGARLLRFVETEYEYGDSRVLTPDIALAGLRKALAEARAPKTVVSLALPAEQCILREITVPFTQDEQIAKVAKFEFEPHLHNASIEDVVIDYVKTGAARQGTRLLVFAVQKSLLRTRLEQLGEAGVDPLHVDVDVAALYNVARQSGVLAEHPNCLLIDIGARTTKALSIQDGRIKVARSIRLGAQTPLQRLETQFQGDRDAARAAMEGTADAESLAQAPGHVPSTLEIVSSVQEIEAAVARTEHDEFLSRVLRETQRSMPAAPGDKAVSRVFLTGGGARHPRARERIAAHFGCEVVDLPVLAAVTHGLAPSEAQRVEVSGAIAVGTGLKVLGVDAGEIDVRREEFRFARTFDQVKVAMAVGVTLLFFAAFVLWLTQFVRLDARNKEIARLNQVTVEQLTKEVFEQYQETVPSPRKDTSRSTDPEVQVARARARMKAIRGHLKEQLGLATEVPPIRSCLETWGAVMTAVKDLRPAPGQTATPKQVEYLVVKDEKYTQEKGEIAVVVNDLPDGDKLVEALRKRTDLFETVELKSPKPLPKEQKYEITIVMSLLPKTADERDETETSAAPATDGDAATTGGAR